MTTHVHHQHTVFIPGASANQIVVKTNTVTNVGSNGYAICTTGDARVQNNTLTGGTGANIGIYPYNLSNSGSVVVEGNNITGFIYGIATQSVTTATIIYNTVRRTLELILKTGCAQWAVTAGPEIRTKV